LGKREGTDWSSGSLPLDSHSGHRPRIFCSSTEQGKPSSSVHSSLLRLL
jgi:hypothetical protein